MKNFCGYSFQIIRILNTRPKSCLLNKGTYEVTVQVFDNTFYARPSTYIVKTYLWPKRSDIFSVVVINSIFNY